MRIAKLSLVAVLVGLLGLANVANADDITLAAVPPVVVQAVPEAGSADVDPTVAEIKVTVSKDSFPDVTGKPHYLPDKRTCVLPVQLKPGTTYAIWINSQKFGNFKDADGRSAVPYLLVFQTKSL